MLKLRFGGSSMQSAVSDYSNALYNLVQDGGRIESDHRSGADFEKENGK